MLEQSSEEYTSSPIVLGIAGSIVVSALGGWFLLNNKAVTRTVDETATSSVLAIALPKAAGADTTVDVDAELRKARLSADAGLLVSPRQQNALYFYGRVLAADAEHAIANAELDAVMAGISLVVDDHLAADEFGAAYELAVSAAGLVPDHPRVDVMSNDLNEHLEALVSEATTLAKEGDDAKATATLAMLEGVPGLNADYLAAVQREVVEAQESRKAAEQEREKSEQLAKVQADLEWQQQVRDAISAGNLLLPEAESARDLLGARDADAELKEPLTAELRMALIAASRENLDAGRPADAEAYLTAAIELGADDDELVGLRADIEQALIEDAGNAVVALGEFVRLNTAEAKYPRRATQRNLAGWVDVAFTVTSMGETADIDIVRAEPANVFEESVIEAVQQWTFEPRQFRGQPIDQRTAARLVFNLE